jgi:hypothetical protein
MDFPEPDAPTKPRISPAPTLKDTCLMMGVAPMVTLNSSTRSACVDARSVIG